MPLDKQQVRRLLAFIADTRDDEIDCDECLAGMAEFAEAELVGVGILDGLKRIEAHISGCPECAEEYGLLRDVLRNASSSSID